MEFRDLLVLLGRQKKKLLGVPLAAGLLFLLMLQILPAQYKATASLMLTNKAYSSWVNTYDQGAVDLEVVKSSVKLIESNGFLGKVMKTLPFYTDLGTLRSAIKIENPKTTKIIIVSVVYNDPQKAAQIVNTVVNLFPERVASVFQAQKIFIIEPAVVPAVPYQANAALSLGLIVVISFSWVLSIVVFAANKSWEGRE